MYDILLLSLSHLCIEGLTNYQEDVWNDETILLNSSRNWKGGHGLSIDINHSLNFL